MGESNDYDFGIEPIEVRSEEIVDKDSYVVHGAIAVCNWGSRPSKLVVPGCHGTYIHDMPVMTVADCKPTKNIQPFGYCLNPNNLRRQEEIQRIQKNVKKSGGFFNDVMNIFGTTREGKGVGADLSEGIVIPCTPMFAKEAKWEPTGKEIRFEIKGERVLRVDCQIECICCGGMIQILEDGQENAAKEQSVEVFDVENWKEGDPLPEPTKKNLEALEKNLEALTKELKECLNNPYEEDKYKATRLMKEVQEKKELHTSMKETQSILEDIRVRQALEVSVENPTQTVKAVEETVERVITAANVVQTVQGENKLEPLEVKTTVGKELKESSERYEALEKTKQEVIAQYNKGTSCMRFTNERVQKELTEISNHGYQIADFIFGGGGYDFYTNPENAGQEGYDIFTNREAVAELYREPIEQNVLPDNTLIYQNGTLASKGEYRKAIDTEIREYLKTK